MNRKTFSLVTSLAILTSSLSPAWAAGKDFTYQNLNQTLLIKVQVDETKEVEEKIDLPLVTETMPDESVRNKYARIIFVPETKVVNNVMQYGKLLDKDRNEVSLSDIPCKIESRDVVVKGKEFYVLKSAKWKDVKDYEVNEKKVLSVRRADNNESDPEKKKIHKFLGWKHRTKKVSLYDGYFKIDFEKYSIDNPVIFQSVFDPLSYFYSISHLDSLDADGYKLTNSSNEYYKVEFFSNGNTIGSGAGFRFNDSQIKYAYKEANNSKNVVLHLRWNSGDYRFGDYKPQTVNIKDKTFWYWTYDKNSHEVVKDDTKLSISRPTFIAKYIVDFLGIDKDFDLKNNPIPEGCHELKLEVEDGYSFNSVPYEKFAVRDGLSLANISVLEKPILKDKNNINYYDVAWYDGYKKIDNLSEFKINSDTVLTARKVRDYESEKFIPEVKEIEVKKNEEVTLEKLKTGITNLPENVEIIEIIRSPDTSKVGKSKATLKIIFSDTSSKEVEIIVKVIEKINGGTITPIPKINESDIIKEEVPYNGKINLLDNINNLPEGARVEDLSDPIDTNTPGTYTGKVRVTFKDGSSRILEIPIEVLIPMAEKFPPQRIEKIQVENLEILSPLEKSEIEEKIKVANPQARLIEVDDKGNVTLVYGDGSTNRIQAEDLIILKEKTPDKEGPEDKPGKDEGEKNPEDKPENGEDKNENDKDKENSNNKNEEKNPWNEFPRYYVRSHRTPTYKVVTKINNKESKPKLSSKIFVIDTKTGTYTIREDGKTLEKLMEVKPVIKDDRTNLPLRALAEILDAKVIWNEATRTASFTREGFTALIQIDGKKIVLSNGETIELESKALNINGRIYLPLVYVGQVFGLTSGNSLDGEDQDIEWNDKDKTVTINIK